MKKNIIESIQEAERKLAEQERMRVNSDLEGLPEDHVYLEKLEQARQRMEKRQAVKEMVARRLEKKGKLKKKVRDKLNRRRAEEGSGGDVVVDIEKKKPEVVDYARGLNAVLSQEVNRLLDVSKKFSESEEQFEGFGYIKLKIRRAAQMISSMAHALDESKVNISQIERY